MNNTLLVSVLGEDRPGLLSEIARIVLDCGCTITDGRMSVLSGECSLVLSVNGNWNTLAKLETQLKKMEQSQNLLIASKRSQERQTQEAGLPYSVEVVAPDQPGIVYRLTGFFASRNINIEEMISRGYSAPHTGAPMAIINMVIALPNSTHIALLRDEFMDLCDEFNWDAVIEPVKG